MTIGTLQRGLLTRAIYAFLAGHVLFPILWLAILLQDGPRMNDWRHFQVAAEQFVAGDWTELYTERQDTVHAGYFWRYPPFVLYVVAPLAGLPSGFAYALLATLGVAALVGSMFLLRRNLPTSQLHSAWALAVVLSPPALTTLIAGQISGLLLLCLVSAAMLWLRGKTVAASAVLGLLAIKPNIGAFFALYLIVTRQWRAAMTMMAVVAALCLTTLPLGPALWQDFIRVSLANVDVTAMYDPYKMITLRAFLNTVLGPDSVAFGVWVLTATLLMYLSTKFWRRSNDVLEHFSVATMLAIAVNPYGFFYDALILTLPATVWWIRREQWRTPTRGIVGALLVLIWCWEHWAFTWRELLKFVGLDAAPPFSIVGPAVGVWLIATTMRTRESMVAGNRVYDFDAAKPFLKP
jgi:hypothetical protein